MQLEKIPTFKQKGLKGYSYPIKNKNVGFHLIDVTKGHDTYIISKKCTHIYYVLEGKGTFDIEDKIEHVSKGEVIEVPPKITYTYTGSMKLLLVMSPRWFEGNEIIVKNNPNVIP